jgi:Tetratricopeptide repeat
MLEKAEELHQTALRLTKAAFGEQNVQTAKHYGNLGRLYQSMKKYEVRHFFSIKGFEVANYFLYHAGG